MRAAPRAFAPDGRQGARSFFWGTAPGRLKGGSGKGPMKEYTSLEKIRLQKIEELRAEGLDPYPTRAQRTHTSMEAIAAFEAAEKAGTEVRATLAGSIPRGRP